MMKSGLWSIALILLIAVCRVAVTSGLAGLLKPMWLSLIWTKVKSPPLPPLRCAVLANARDDGMPPLIVQTSPVPAHAMHFRNPRRSMPSLSRSCNFWSIRSLFWSVICPPVFLSAFTVDNWNESLLFPLTIEGQPETSTVAWTALPTSLKGKDCLAEYNGHYLRRLASGDEDRQPILQRGCGSVVLSGAGYDSPACPLHTTVVLP